MPDEMENGRINRILIEALKKEMQTLEAELKQTRDSLGAELKQTRDSLAKTREELSSVRAEVRIFGAIIMALLIAIIGMVFNHLTP